jgi:hypothetical protein
MQEVKNVGTLLFSDEKSGNTAHYLELHQLKDALEAEQTRSANLSISLDRERGEKDVTFICLSPRSCCFSPRFLMPFLHTGPFQRLFRSIRPFRVSRSVSSLFCPVRPCPAQRVIFIPATVTFRSPQNPWVRIFLKTLILRHATAARRAATKFFWHSSFLWVRFCSFFLRRLAYRSRSCFFWRRTAARCHWSRRFFPGSPTGATSASSTGTSCSCATSQLRCVIQRWVGMSQYYTQKYK